MPQTPGALVVPTRVRRPRPHVKVIDAPRHIEPGTGRVPGLDPQRRSYFSRATFADPDANTWTLQEITERLPGRVEKHDSGALAQLLFETARRHGQFEAVAPRTTGGTGTAPTWT